ncbi:MAG: hypothetical protein Q8N08_09715 [Methanobacteriaceae archaeon]|nr:hypothetical protein [Methanobacteriaceae archaeon]
MENYQLLKTLKIMAVLALIFGVIGAVMYLAYGFTLVWQGMAAGITIGFLLVLLIILLGLSIYIWIKMLLVKRELKRCQEELAEIYRKKTVKVDEES